MAADDNPDMTQREPDLDQELALGSTRNGREVYEELLCDWPLLAPDDVRALTEALQVGSTRARASFGRH
jgi:hypothetical protein